MTPGQEDGVWRVAVSERRGRGRASPRGPEDRLHALPGVTSELVDQDDHSAAGQQGPELVPGRKAWDQGNKQQKQGYRHEEDGRPSCFEAVDIQNPARSGYRTRR